MTKLKFGLTYLSSAASFLIFAAEAGAQPTIHVDPPVVFSEQPIPAGGNWSQSVTVRNDGYTALEITGIEVVELGGGPAGWLSVTPTSLTVQPGPANAQQIEVRIDASRCDLSTYLSGELRIVSNATSGNGIVFAYAGVTNPAQEVHWDTVMTHQGMFDPNNKPGVECVALTMSDCGAFGLPGWNDLGLDYYASGTECGDRDADRVYLNSGSPFVMIKDGDNVSLTTSIYQSGTLKPYHWRQASGSPGMSGGPEWYFDFVFVGRLVNRDTTIGLERTFYAPRSYNLEDVTDFIVCHTVIYSVDGQPHDHVTVGDVIDWNVPSERVNSNTSGSYNERFTYVQGTDTSGASCQAQANRYATEILWGFYTSAENPDYYCGLHSLPPNIRALGQWLLEDTVAYRDGTPLTPAQPNPRVWWEETSVPGWTHDSMAKDQAIWLTYQRDFTLSATDTLNFWTSLLTVRNGTLPNLAEQACDSKLWWKGNLSGCSYPASCCDGRVGDVDGSGMCWEDVSISDVSALIDAKFITGACILSGPNVNIPCLARADINQSGGVNPTCDDITISDISILIDYLFITGPTLVLPYCF